MNRADVRAYAKSLYKVASRSEIFPRIAGELQTVWTILRSEARYLKFLQNPLVPLKERVSIMEKMTLKTHPVTATYLDLLMRRYALGYMGEIISIMDDMKVEDEGGLVATLEVPEPLDEKTLATITASVEKLTKKKPKFHITTNPDLIGGFRIRSESYLIDATMMGLLKKLSRGGSHGS